MTAYPKICRSSVGSLKMMAAITKFKIGLIYSKIPIVEEFTPFSA
jgi:hypothetical protein